MRESLSRTRLDLLTTSKALLKRANRAAKDKPVLWTAGEKLAIDKRLQFASLLRRVAAGADLDLDPGVVLAAAVM